MSTAESAPLTWFKSSHSGNGGGECLEVAVTPGAIHIRDSKAPARVRLTVSAAEWAAFVRFAGER